MHKGEGKVAGHSCLLLEVDVMTPQVYKNSGDLIP